MTQQEIISTLAVEYGFTEEMATKVIKDKELQL